MDGERMKKFSHLKEEPIKWLNACEGMNLEGGRGRRRGRERERETSRGTKTVLEKAGQNPPRRNLSKDNLLGISKWISLLSRLTKLIRTDVLGFNDLLHIFSNNGLNVIIVVFSVFGYALRPPILAPGSTNISLRKF